MPPRAAVLDENATLSVDVFREKFWRNDKKTSVVGWLPFLWSKVLFAGACVQSEVWSWRPFLLLIAFSSALLYPWMNFHLFEPDEGRYAQIPREMLERGEWIVPYLQGEPYLDKPPLYYWSVMLCYALFGYQNWAARLVPALAVQGGVLITFLFGRKIAGERAAWWGSLLLMLAPGFVGMGRLALLDGLLTLWVTLALFCAYFAVRGDRLQWGWWLSLAVAEGLGVMTKGPVALVLVLAPLLAWRWLSRVPWRIGARAWLAFAGVVLCLALPWYVAVCWKMPDFALHFLWEHNVMRFMQPFDHEEPIWFFAPIILGGLLPGILLLPAWVKFLLSGRDQESEGRCPAMGFLLLAGLWCLAFFSLSGSKLPTYILPAFPPLALALGMFVARTSWGAWRGMMAVAALWGELLLAAHALVIPQVAYERSPLKHAATLDLLCRDPAVPVYCFPRNIDSAAFHLGRSDLVNYRTKDMADMFEEIEKHPRSVILFAHRESSKGLEACLPPHLKMTYEAPLGLCDVAVIERR